MNTTRPCSSIAYAPAAWLELKLSELEYVGTLDWWAFIEHHAEEDEKKDHTHLILYPGKKVDTQSLRDILSFSDLHAANPAPARPLPFVRTNSFQDWYLYVLHDADYLAQHRQSRKFHYRHEDIHTSDAAQLLEFVHQIDWTKINVMGQVIDSAMRGESFADYVINNHVNVNSVRSLAFVHDLATSHKVTRALDAGGHPIVTHDRIDI